MKTAEDIIQETTGVKGLNGPLTPMDYGECVKCVQAALQEVEAYKERLRHDCDNMLGGPNVSNLTVAAAEIMKALIDTAK